MKIMAVIINSGMIRNVKNTSWSLTFVMSITAYLIHFWTRLNNTSRHYRYYFWARGQKLSTVLRFRNY